METKHCPRGDHEVALDGFNTRPNGNLQSWCKSCHREYARGRDRQTRRALQVPRTLHQVIKTQAAANGLSMNQFLIKLISHGVANQCGTKGCLRPVPGPASRDRVCEACERKFWAQAMRVQEALR